MNRSRSRSKSRSRSRSKSRSKKPSRRVLQHLYDAQLYDTLIKRNIGIKIPVPKITITKGEVEHGAKYLNGLSKEERLKLYVSLVPTSKYLKYL